MSKASQLKTATRLTIVELEIETATVGLRELVAANSRRHLIQAVNIDCRSGFIHLDLGFQQ